MTTSITIRHVPTATRDELASRAKASGRSLQEYLLAELIRMTEQPDMDQLLAEIRADVQASGHHFTSEDILAAIHDGRR